MEKNPGYALQPGLLDVWGFRGIPPFGGEYAGRPVIQAWHGAGRRVWAILTTPAAPTMAPAVEVVSER